MGEETDALRHRHTRGEQRAPPHRVLPPPRCCPGAEAGPGARAVFLPRKPHYLQFISSQPEPSRQPAP